MWINRDIESHLALLTVTNSLPIKVLKGPRQVGKTSLLLRMGGYTPVYLDDAATRLRVKEDPRFFLDNLPSKIILDEGTLVPELFLELKRRVDEFRRSSEREKTFDVWITGSNQTLLQREVKESLAGRASFFELPSLSIHEIKAQYDLGRYVFRGGWPELAVQKDLPEKRYLDDLITSFIERDIVSAAGIEKKAAFIKVLGLTAGRIGQLYNFSDIATAASVELTTVQSWCLVLEENGILRRLPPYFTNTNKRLIKAPKFYFEDVSIATRIQGWSELQPLMVSPALGSFIENIAVSEVVKFYLNRGESPKLNFVRSKEKVEIDLLIHLPNRRTIAAEIKTTPIDFSEGQLKLLDSLDLDIIERWVISPEPAMPFRNSRVVSFASIFEELAAHWS